MSQRSLMPNMLRVRVMIWAPRYMMRRSGFALALAKNVTLEKGLTLRLSSSVLADHEHG